MYLHVQIDSTHRALAGPDATLEAGRLLNLVAVHLQRGDGKGACKTSDGVTVGQWTTERVAYDYATDQVALWIESDGEYFDMARELATDGRVAELAVALTRLILTSPSGSAPAAVRAVLGQAELTSVDWLTVAARLT